MCWIDFTDLNWSERCELWRGLNQRTIIHRISSVLTMHASIQQFTTAVAPHIFRNMRHSFDGWPTQNRLTASPANSTTFDGVKFHISQLLPRASLLLLPFCLVSSSLSFRNGKLLERELAGSGLSTGKRSYAAVVAGPASLSEYQSVSEDQAMEFAMKRSREDAQLHWLPLFFTVEVLN